MKNEFLRRFMQIDRVLDNRDTHWHTKQHLFQIFWQCEKSPTLCLWALGNQERIGVECHFTAWLLQSRLERLSRWRVDGLVYWPRRTLGKGIESQTLQANDSWRKKSSFSQTTTVRPRRRIKASCNLCAKVCYNMQLQQFTPNGLTYSSKINTIDSLYKVREGNTLETSLFVGGMVLNMIYKCSAIAETWHDFA